MAGTIPKSLLCLKAALIYFSLVFAAGFALGTIRVLWMQPLLGERTAEFLEMPFMLIATILAAHWVVKRNPRVASPGLSLAVGSIALLLLLSLELTLVLSLRGLSFADYVASRDPASGTAYLLMLGIYALMPLLLGLLSSRR